jgi:hypothetical protein
VVWRRPWRAPAVRLLLGWLAMNAPALNLAARIEADKEILHDLIDTAINRLNPAASSYRTSPIKRGGRRTKAEMANIRTGLRAIIAAEQPMTVRQVFYQAVVEGLIEKTEAEYQNTVARLLLDMRRAGEIPYSWTADNTRWMRKPTTYAGLAAFVDRHQRTYRRDLWAEADVYTEIWLEKEALAGVVIDVTDEFDVPLMVSRGFASESYLYSAADVITDQLVAGKQQAIIYYFGDLDPSGLHISTSIERGLRRLCPILCKGFEPEMLVFERMAVNDGQAMRWNLPSRPTKTSGNKHAKDWPDGRPSVELDAMPPSELRSMVRLCIEQHVDADQLGRLRAVEEEERQQLRIFGQQIAGSAR